MGWFRTKLSEMIKHFDSRHNESWYLTAIKEHFDATEEIIADMAKMNKLLVGYNQNLAAASSAFTGAGRKTADSGKSREMIELNLDIVKEIEDGFKQLLRKTKTRLE